MVKAVLLPVDDGTIGEQRRQTVAAGCQQRRQPLDVEQGVLLTRKAGFGQIFGRGAGADRHRAAPQILVGCGDLCLQQRRPWGCRKQLTRSRSGALKVVQIVGIQTRQQCRQAIAHSPLPLRIGLLEQQVIGLSCGRKPRRNGDACCGKVLKHLSQRGVLAADAGDVIQPHACEGHHERGHAGLGHCAAATVTSSRAVSGRWCSPVPLLRLNPLHLFC